MNLDGRCCWKGHLTTSHCMFPLIVVLQNGAVEATTGSRFGAGQGPIVLDDVDCQGDEGELLSCPSPGLGIHNCGHHEDAGVVCQSNGKKYFRIQTEYKQV